MIEHFQIGFANRKLGLTLPDKNRKAGDNSAGHIAKPRAPECQRIDDRFAQNDFLRSLQRMLIPHAPMRAGKIQMQRRPFPGDSA